VSFLLQLYIVCMNKITSKKEAGFALLLALIVASIVLSIGLSMLSVTIKQLDLGTTTRGSEVAFQVASAGLECLRYMRDTQSTEFETGSAVSFDCFDFSTITQTDNFGPNIYSHSYSADWEIEVGEDRCVEMDVYIYNASLETNPILFTGFRDREIENGQCNSGDICTIGFVRGYNRACGDLNDIFTVQRELTIQF